MTVEIALLCSQIIQITWLFWLATRVARASRQASLAMKRTPAPEKWESRLRELEDELSSLSSSYEKNTKLLRSLNSRAGMRELRAREADPSDAPPPPGASKAELRAHYRVGGISGRAMADKMKVVSTEE